MRNKKLIPSLATATAICASLALSVLSAHAGPVVENKRIQHTERAERNEQGQALYWISINPFFTDKYREEALARGYNPPVKPDEAKGNENWQLPEILYIRDLLAAKYGLKSEHVLSWGGLAITSFLDEEAAQKILDDELVYEITQVPVNSAVTSQAAGDTWTGFEVIPWARPAVNIYDSTYNGQYVHIVDMVLPYSLPPNELNVVYRWDQAAPDMWGQYHSLHVAGIIGARDNSARIRGISPNVPIASHGWDYGSWASLAVAIDNAIYVSEINGTHSQMNISVNTNGAGVNQFAHNEMIGKRLRAASNRNFITESAGNNDADACTFSFSYSGSPRQYDGIMVVGGTKLDGDRMTGGFNPIDGFSPTPTVPGSNYGGCVEVWAPGQDISSLHPGTSLTRISTGTSYSAPIVAAIASRIGTTATRPIQREWYIRNNLVNPGGHTDPSSRPILKARYNGTSLGTIPKVLPIYNGWSPTSLTNLSALWDGLYSSGASWSAGANWGSVTLDLGSVRTVKGVRLTLRSSSTDTSVDFAVLGDNSGLTSVATILGYHNEPLSTDMAPVYIPLAGHNVRYLRIDGNAYGSWLSYSEIEVYGE